MSVIKIRKVVTLPGTYEPSTMYMVQGADASLMELYVSSNDGASIKHLINKSDIQAMISTAMASYNALDVVADIAARDALAPTVVRTVLVLDATDDTTVTSGGATYVYNPATTTWYKIAEFESMDVVLQWESIQGRPTASPAQIDTAVAQSHTHSNKAVLDGLSIVDGELYSAGAPIQPHLEENAW